MANLYRVGSEVTDEDGLDLELVFDDEEDDFLERSQRKLLSMKRARAARRERDWE